MARRRFSLTYPSKHFSGLTHTHTHTHPTPRPRLGNETDRPGTRAAPCVLGKGWSSGAEAAPRETVKHERKEKYRKDTS